MTITVASVVHTALLASALAGTAAAQPAATPAPTPASPAPVGVPPVASQPSPAGSDGSDLSHINNTPVKVGEHNEYYYRFRRTNVSTNPVGWMFGFFGLSVEHALTQHIVLRADANYYHHVFDSDDLGYEVGVGVPIYFRRAYQGLFLEPGFILRHSDDDDSGAYHDDYDYDDGYTQSGPQMLVGWHWTWDSGLNMAFAVGGGRDLSSESNELMGNGYLRFGYAF